MNHLGGLRVNIHSHSEGGSGITETENVFLAGYIIH
jgi:hypothetical protein